MNLRNLFRVIGVLFLFSGVSFLVVPKALPAAYGVDIDSYTAFFLQQLGAINVASAVLCFLVSGMAHSPARQAVVTFFFVEQLLGIIVNLLGVLGGAVPAPAGWIGVALSLILALAFGYFGFIRPESTVAPGLQS